mmetsp:Transcript_18912/g.28531  ORF Transcript_18912/g.28531 Transcript_18912/m.28531 type:complete len:110 (-) Transcript_18912:223-552(-)|eukprot:CAMPEP_0178913832 /NCGR_PEP_ID=MMETSP0786-20121207/11065_1 /TAXON_ID=186022 /ORGANISM="Thalassionema frauenfeldii, Strain CCMP 1798" /LENGTH=109 /DNA_ID=CAMNT_0020586625 /DNA_START=63 /DNA_END=392 /DNA_ORIENTATION=+
MMKSVFVFLAFLATASAFVPAPAAFVAKTSLEAIKPQQIAAAVAGAVPAILSSTAAVATEGTGEWFGVDDGRVLAVLFIGHWAVLTLWLQAYGDYDEEQDFFGEIDYTK